MASGGAKPYSRGHESASLAEIARLLRAGGATADPTPSKASKTKITSTKGDVEDKHMMTQIGTASTKLKEKEPIKKRRKNDTDSDEEGDSDEESEEKPVKPKKKAKVAKADTSSSSSSSDDSDDSDGEPARKPRAKKTPAKTTEKKVAAFTKVKKEEKATTKKAKKAPSPSSSEEDSPSSAPESEPEADSHSDASSASSSDDDEDAKPAKAAKRHQPASSSAPEVEPPAVVKGLQRLLDSGEPSSVPFPQAQAAAQAGAEENFYDACGAVGARAAALLAQLLRRSNELLSTQGPGGAPRGGERAAAAPTVASLAKDLQLSGHGALEEQYKNLPMWQALSKHSSHLYQHVKQALKQARTVTDAACAEDEQAGAAVGAVTVKKTFRDYYVETFTDTFVDELDEIRKADGDGHVRVDLILKGIEAGLDVFSDLEKKLVVDALQGSAKSRKQGTAQDAMAARI